MFLLPGCPLLIQILLPFKRRTADNTADIKHFSASLKDWKKKRKTKPGLSVHSSNCIVLPWLHSTPPPSSSLFFSPNEWTSRQALAPSTGQQLKKRIHNGKVGHLFLTERGTLTHVLLTPTWARPLLHFINLRDFTSCTMLHSHQGSYNHSVAL